MLDDDVKDEVLLKIAEKFDLCGVRKNSEMWKAVFKPVEDALDEL